MIKLRTLKPNPENPRVILDHKFAELVSSLKEFPDMMELRPIIVDDKNMVLGGNMRLKALEFLDYKTIPDTWVKSASHLSPEERKRFLIADNLNYGSWDWDKLANEWDTEQLQGWGVEIPDFNAKNILGDAAKASLAEKFLVPPFTVLDGRQGYWQDRKRNWNRIIGDKAETRENTLFNAKGSPVAEYITSLNNGTSILDPVVAELANHWFCPREGKTFDPFAGDGVFGFVSAYMGHAFTGIELRPEQAAENTARVQGMAARYIVDDGQNVASHLEVESQDLLFSCPPYFDLEVYSDLQQDASNQKTYGEFLQILKTAFTAAVQCLKNNRFAFIVVGDIRDKKGVYRRFPDHITEIFIAAGMELYNELILVDPVGSARLRAAGAMMNRKVIKTHQNCLVFYKGDTRKIKTHFPAVEVPEYNESTDLHS